jgi:hypothetical protein
MEKMTKIALLLIAIVGFAFASTANAGTNVSSNITTDTHWTEAGSPYHLKTQIYVEPGATLTIDANVVVANFVDDQGSLAVCRGAKIYVNGERGKPVIMTSAEDVANWTGSVVTRGGSNGTVSAITTVGDHKSGIWLARCNDWGNLTVMGNALISASHYGGVPVGSNTKCPSGLNEKQMEGLTNPTLAMYGGNNDDDDSGEIHFLSIRYGGKVIGLANELNGLSMGGIGRATDVDHIDIMNNVDDGIEIWGGTVCLKYVNIWNIGDDSFDVDEGWRGSAQYGLIVQGYSVAASQGSGVGDNCFETDGAEDSDAQPVTTARICNFTVVGQPVAGDHGTAWRDNARIQYNNCIWMDLGEQLVKYDNTDGDGAHGYGYNGTLSWADTWTTSYAEWIVSPQAQVNLCGESLSDIYGQYILCPPDANLACITDSIFFGNEHASAYTEATNRGVLSGNCNKVVEDYNLMPIQYIKRSGPVYPNGYEIYPVTYINPCAAYDAAVSYIVDPEDANNIQCNCKELNGQPCIQPAPFKGGFSPYYNWLQCWTAVDAYGMTDTRMNTHSDPTSMIIPKDGDLDNDMDIDFDDFAVLANSWLTRE